MAEARVPYLPDTSRVPHAALRSILRMGEGITVAVRSLMVGNHSGLWRKVAAEITDLHFATVVRCLEMGAFLLCHVVNPSINLKYGEVSTHLVIGHRTHNAPSAAFGSSSGYRVEAGRSST